MLRITHYNFDIFKTSGTFAERESNWNYKIPDCDKIYP